MIRQHLGSIILAVAILIAAIILACANRYEWAPTGINYAPVQTFDRWTGKFGGIN
jgi:hypothetical protein